MASATTIQSQRPNAVAIRLPYLDNLRVLLICLIVLLHLAITYGAPGSWYVHEVDTGNLGLGALIIFSIYNATVQAFALGFFFFISGYFTASSLERKGPRRFLKDRLVRLGIPLMAYMFVLNPVTIYLLRNRGRSISSFVFQYFSTWQFSTGPMWFVAALLLFSLVYILWDTVRNNRTDTAPIPSSQPRIWLLFLFVMMTGLAAFGIRLFFHVGWSVPVLNFQLGYFAEYIATFFLGTVAWRIRWFDQLSSYRTPVWFGYTAIVIALLPVMLISSGADGGLEPFEGGTHWQALAYAMWEPFVCIGMIIGLSSLFIRRMNRQRGLFGLLAPNAYAVYVIHPQIMILLTVAAGGVILPPLLKFAIMSPVVLTACFMTAMLLRAIPGVNRVL